MSHKYFLFLFIFLMAPLSVFGAEQGVVSLDLVVPKSPEKCTEEALSEQRMLVREDHCQNVEPENMDAVRNRTSQLYVNNVVTMQKNGIIKVCSQLVVWDENCKPVNSGKVVYCDHLKGSRCGTIKKDDDKFGEFNERLTALFGEASSNPNHRRDVMTKSLLHDIQTNLQDSAKGSGNTVFRDDYGVLFDRAGEPEVGNGEQRFVSVPSYSAERLLEDPGLPRRVQEYVDNNLSGNTDLASPVRSAGGFRQNLGDGLDGVAPEQPFAPWARPSYSAMDTDTGVRVNSFAGDASITRLESGARVPFLSDQPPAQPRTIMERLYRGVDVQAINYQSFQGSVPTPRVQQTGISLNTQSAPVGFFRPILSATSQGWSNIRRWAGF